MNSIILYRFYKRVLLILLIFMSLYVASLFSSCGTSNAEDTGATSRSQSQTKTVDDVINENINQSKTVETSSAGDDEPEIKADNIANINGTVDMDLSAMSATMCYSQVYEFYTNPAEYIDKTIKIKGLINKVIDPSTENTYYICSVMDATQCCTQGLEFIPDNWVKEYDNTTQCVTGVFNTYIENGIMYCTLKNAIITGE